ncbi:hypothetical protein [Aureivirga sp. CE67]|uniref:hypothetical protein n=1 Tax=Aureivirga sp. CE67 TaxID=1788983 RepID=UPI0018CB3A97|nr:hypothetical protein [Aureivirga sp. CE67]
MKNELHDVVFQVLVKNKSLETINSVLNEFIPEYEKLDSDYVGKPEEDDFVFESEEQMLNYYLENENISQVFYWNKYENNPDKIMVGVHILKSNEMIVSLTVEVTEEKENKYLKKLKAHLKSKIGMITYINPINCETGEEFEKIYLNQK